MSKLDVRWIGEPHVYEVDKERSLYKADEIEVKLFYRKGHGFRATITPQLVENHGNIKMTSFDFWNVKTRDVIPCQRFSKKKVEEAIDTLADLEPYWVAQMASALGLVLKHDPIHGNW